MWKSDFFLELIFFLLSIFYGFWPPRARISQKSQMNRLILHIKSEKYRPDLALTLSLYLYGGLFLILHIKYWSTYLYGRNLCLTAPYGTGTRYCTVPVHYLLLYFFGQGNN